MAHEEFVYESTKSEPSINKCKVKPCSLYEQSKICSEGAGRYRTSVVYKIKYQKSVIGYCSFSLHQVVCSPEIPHGTSKTLPCFFVWKKVMASSGT